MPDQTFYFRLASGVLQAKTNDTGFVPPTPVGATVLTAAQYNAEVAALKATRTAAEGATRTAEATADKLKYNGNVRIVASATAPANVKAISNYICDGTDDQVQINQALTDVDVSGGGVVQLSTGIFLLSDSVLVPPGGGTSLHGTSWDSVLKVAGGSNRYAVRFNGPGETRTTIRDLTVDGNYFEQTTGGGGIWAAGAVQCHFDTLHFVACYDVALDLGPMPDNPAIFGHTNYITSCLFDNMAGSPGQGVGIHTTSNDENFIIGCDFEFMGGATGLATSIYDQAGTQLIQGCNFVNGRADKATIRIQDCSATKVLGSNFDGVSGTAIVAAASRCLISDNTFFGVGLNGTPGANTGIHLEFASSNNTVADNMLATAPANGAAHSLIREVADGGGGNNYIQGNTLVQNGTAVQGLLDLSGTGSWVRGNKGAGPVGDETPPLKVVAGPVSDASYPANRPPVSGSMALDTTNSRIYFRVGAVWKYAALT